MNKIVKRNVSLYPNCYGCGICVIACPKNIISLSLENGFYRPSISETDCIKCGLCLAVCAFHQDKNENYGSDIQFYAAYSKDENVRNRCSSGGIGFELVKYAVRNGFSFCGVRYNVQQERAEHYVTDQIEELYQGAGSKYIQSYTLTGFSQFEKGQKYCVVGTPCQIDSLRRYVRKNKIEDDFVLIDFFCHGVPSQLMWKKYLDLKKHEVGEPIKYVSWRNKQNGWQDSYVMEVRGKKNSFSLKSEGDLFYKFFLKNRCLAKACYDNCKYKMVSSAADIRIGDLWGTKYQDVRKGVSAVVVFTDKGKKLLNAISNNCTLIPESMEVVTGAQMKTGAKKPSSYKYVHRKLQTELPLAEIDKIASWMEKIGDDLPWAIKYYPHRILEIIRCKLGL